MEKNFFKVPNHLFEHGLSSKAIVVYCALMRHAGTKLMCYPARKTISAECNISASTVDRALAELASTGLIKKVNRKNVIGGKTSNIPVNFISSGRFACRTENLSRFRRKPKPPSVR